MSQECLGGILREKLYIHVHVGKCGGGTVNKVLNRANMNFEELHCKGADERLAELLSNDDDNLEFIITIRDPISRFLSAFNFDKYEKIIINKAENPVWKSIYTTFESANHLAISLNSDNTEIRSLAWVALEESFLHMHYGLAWYFSRCDLSKIQPEKTSIIRQEFLEKDVHSFLESYSLNPDVMKLSQDKNHTKFIKNIGIHNPLYLSDEAKSILVKVFEKDYKILDYFYHLGLIPDRYQRALTTAY